MSKKHFIALADAIKQHNAQGAQKFTQQQLETLAAFCSSQNPNFNRQRWMDYINGQCGPSGGTITK